MYDRLNRLGVVVPYCNVLDTINKVGEMYPKLLVQALKDGKYVRFVGDNLNFSTGTSHETKENHKHMVHMFTSTALVYDYYYLDMTNEPEIDFNQLQIDDLLPSREEYELIRKDIVKMVVDIVGKYLPFFAFAKKSVPGCLQSLPEEQKARTDIIPLPCLPFNEQKYQDDVKILEWYQQLAEKIIRESGIDGTTKFQIGGDQLTRERFTEALLLRLDNINPGERFANIGRCTAEFFHLGMNYMEKCIFSELWNGDGRTEMGTLRGECERLCRSQVDPNVMKAYDADKRFVSNYINANIIEAAMTFFGMEDRNSHPTLQTPPRFNGLEEQTQWVYDVFGNFVDQYVYPCWSGEDKQNTVEEGTCNYMHLFIYLFINREFRFYKL